ncbi:MAG: hypothetical protein RL653_631 [Pseudomonadota bacterium]|jgi:hypothetical protein
METGTGREGGEVHAARKGLFTKGLRAGFLSLQEVEQALPPGSLSDAERWLFYASLRAAGVELRDVETGLVDRGLHPEGV